MEVLPRVIWAEKFAAADQAIATERCLREALIDGDARRLKSAATVTR